MVVRDKARAIALALITCCLCGAALAAELPARTVEGPWSGGAYVGLAVHGEEVNAIWLQGERLLHSSSANLGASWSKESVVAEGAEAGDGGQIRPRVALTATGPVVAYSAKHRPYLARLVDGAWVSTLLSEAKNGVGALLDLGVSDGQPFVVWLDTRRDPEAWRSDVYAWVGGKEELVYSDQGDGVCVCCRPAAGLVQGRPAVAFRDADAELREVRLFVRRAEGGWEDRGHVTKGGWSPGGCPGDGPVFQGERVLISDGRSGDRVIYAGDSALIESKGEQIMQPRAAGDALAWIVASPGRRTLVVEGQELASSAGRLEPGDPVLAGAEIWIPWQGEQATVAALKVGGR